jgi:endonuclease-3
MGNQELGYSWLRLDDYRIAVSTKGMRNRRADAARVKRIISKLKREHPDAKLALDFSTPLELLVALVLAAQCTDEKVNQVTPMLFKRYRTAADYAAESQEALEEIVRPTGFYRQKSKSIRACCQQMVDRFGGEVPKDLDDLLSLPGVGRKTANILRGNAFGIPGIGVDTHVSRLSQRLGLTRQHDPDKIEADLVQIVPPKDQVRFCHLLQFHGRRICLARKPKCPKCVIASICPYLNKTKEEVRKRLKRSRWVGTRDEG